MKDFHLNKFTLNNLINELSVELEESPNLIITTQNEAIGKWTMTRLWRSWMSSTASFMYESGVMMPLMVMKDGSNYGSRPFDQNDAHELFTAQHLGVDKEGRRLSWSKSGREGLRPATKGERFFAMQKHEEFAANRGIILLQPKDSEYRKLTDEQNS